MSTRKPPSPEPTGDGPAGEGAPRAPAGPPVDLPQRPSEAELAEQREQTAESGATGTPRPSEAELAEARDVPDPAAPAPES